MTDNLINVNTAYRLIDAMRDYADHLKAIGSNMFELYEADADILEHRAFPQNRNIDGLVTIDGFVKDSAHTAVVALMLNARESAAEARLNAEAYDDTANRYESLMSNLSV